MYKPATTSSSTSVARDATKSKHQSKKGKEAKKQQDADLAYIGSQFQQDNGTYQASGSADYPKTLNFD